MFGLPATPERSRPQSKSNGMPVMDFVCLGPNEKPHVYFIVASSPANYSSFPQMKYMRKEAREDRIGLDNVRSAEQWLERLKTFEETEARRYRMQGLTRQEATIQARTDIIRRQRQPVPPRYIAGLDGHFGQAVNGNYTPEPCCYKCQAMFGFRVILPERFDSADFRETMRRFNWDKANAVACAEFMVAMICQHWPR